MKSCVNLFNDLQHVTICRKYVSVRAPTHSGMTIFPETSGMYLYLKLKEESTFNQIIKCHKNFFIKVEMKNLQFFNIQC